MKSVHRFTKMRTTNHCGFLNQTYMEHFINILECAMASHEKSRTANLPAQSVLASGGAAASNVEPIAPKPASAPPNAFIRDREKLKAGVLPLDHIGMEHVDGLFADVSRANQQERKNFVGRIVGEGPASRIMVREITTEAYLGKGTGARPLIAPAPASGAGYDANAGRPDIAGRPNRLQIAEAVNQRRKYGADFRKTTGFGIALLDPQTAHLLGPDDRVVATLTKSTADMLATDGRFGPALKLFLAAASGERPENLAETAAFAIASARQGRAFGDALIFESDAKRAAMITQGFQKLAEPNLSRKEREIVLQTLTIPLFAEALESRRTHQMLLDISPGLGNARDAEAAYGFAKAAWIAFNRGDHAAAAKLAAASAFSILGAVGGTITPIKAARSKAFRDATSDSIMNLGATIREKGTAAFTGKETAAKLEVERTINRPENKPYNGIRKNRLENQIEDILPGKSQSIMGFVNQAKGVTGELYFAQLVNRWEKDAGIEIELKIRRDAAKASGDDEAFKKFSKLIDEMKLRRGGTEIHPDVIIPGYKLVDENGYIKLQKTTHADSSAPLGIDVKTGPVDGSQRSRYKKHTKPSTTKDNDSQTIIDIAYSHATPREWRRYLHKALKLTLYEHAPKHGVSADTLEKLTASILDNCSIVDFKEWLIRFSSESSVSAGIHSNTNIDHIRNE